MIIIRSVHYHHGKDKTLYCACDSCGNNFNLEVSEKGLPKNIQCTKCKQNEFELGFNA